jgi:hypothetical protein
MPEVKAKVKPIKEYRGKGIRASIWENERTTKEGKKFKAFSVGIVRRYQDKDGNWQETNSFSVDDLPALCAVAQEAYKFCILRTRDETATE